MDLKKLSIGTPPDDVNVVVEIPQGSAVKYEMDKESGAVRVDRFLHTSMVYPFNYGFLPHTLAEDGDPIDVLLIAATPVVPGCVVPSRIIGMLKMEDESGEDTKLIAVPAKKVDPLNAKIDDVSDLDELTQKQISHFFEHYKALEPGKWVRIDKIYGKKEAMDAITEAIARCK